LPQLGRLSGVPGALILVGRGLALGGFLPDDSGGVGLAAGS
jgi:hypothetical protein